MHKKNFIILILIVILNFQSVIFAINLKHTCAEISTTKVKTAIISAQKNLLNLQKLDGSWAAKIYINPRRAAYYILTVKYLKLEEDKRIKTVCKWLLEHQYPDGGWGVFDDYREGIYADASITAIVILALEVAGYNSNHPQLIKAREKLKTLGGIDVINPFMKVFYALYERVSWDDLKFPLPPIEIMLDTDSEGNAIDEMPGWIREGTVALMVLKALHDPNPTPIVQQAIKKSEMWLCKHQLEDGSWFTLRPTCLNMISLYILNKQRHLPRIKLALNWLHQKQDDDGYQHGYELSVWDTALAMLGLLESGLEPYDSRLVKAARWLMTAQSISGGNIWSNVRSGGWSFTGDNIIYPDCDDTGLSTLALSSMSLRSYTNEYQKRLTLERARQWLLYMQNDDGGWGTFIKNQSIKKPGVTPSGFDDPSVADVTSHALMALAKLGYTKKDIEVQKAIDFLKREQLQDGSWYGRWGLCYTYGTSKVLNALLAVKEDMTLPYVKKAISWIKEIQNADGGWGEKFIQWNDTKGISVTQLGKSTPDQTAWSIMGLIAAGLDINDSAIKKGVNYLLNKQEKDGSWKCSEYTALALMPYRNSLYSIYFPLAALGMVLQRCPNNTNISEYTDTYTAAVSDMPRPSSSGDFLNQLSYSKIPNLETVVLGLVEKDSKKGIQILIINNEEDDDVKHIKVFLNEIESDTVKIAKLDKGQILTCSLYVDKYTKNPQATILTKFYFGNKNTQLHKYSIVNFDEYIISNKKSNKRIFVTTIIILLIVPIAIVFIVKMISKVKLSIYKEMLVYILDHINENRVRTLLTLIGMVVGVSAIVSTVSLGLEYRASLDDTLMKGFGDNRIIILPYKLNIELGPPSEKGFDAPPAKFRELDVERINNIPMVSAACPIIPTTADAMVDGKKVKVHIRIVDPKKFKKTTMLRLESGRYISESDKRMVNLGYSIANKAFDKKMLSGMSIEINGKPFNIAGTFKEIGGIKSGYASIVGQDLVVYVPMSAASDFVSHDYYDEIEVKVRDKSEVSKAAERIKNLLNNDHANYEFDVEYAENIREKITTVLFQFNSIFIAIGLFSLIVAGIGIMNMMIVSVTERKKEIGILKALGARPKILRNLFLGEAAILGIIGGIMGSLLGFFVLRIMQAVVGLSSNFNPLLIIAGSIVFAMIIAIISGTYPAQKAARLNPIQAINQ